MTPQTWIDWCQKQLSDMSRRLFRQGYNPVRIEQLNRTSPEFNEHYQTFLDRLERIMDQMAANPQGYHHFEAFTKAKMDLLSFTNHNRARFLETELARTA
jgi:hypothetical protein